MSAARVLGSRRSHHTQNVRTLLKRVEYGDVATAMCGESPTETSESRLLSLWLVNAMLSRRDLCPRGMEHVLVTETNTFACECLPGNPCEQYYEASSGSYSSNVEVALSWTSAVAGVVLVVSGFVRFVVVYNRTVPHQHTHAPPSVSSTADGRSIAARTKPA